MQTRDERGAAPATPLATPLAVVLAAVAVVVVLTTAVLTGLTFRGDGGDGGDTGVAAPAASDATDPSPSGGPGEDPDEEVPSFFPGGQVITGDRRDNADVELPSVEDGWRATESDYAIGYLGRDGMPEVGVTGPYRWRTGPCGDEEDAQRAFVGFTAPTTDSGEPGLARRSVEIVVEAWERTISRDRETIGVSDVETGSTSISDGSDAATARFVFRTSGESADCFPPAYELRFLSFDTGDFAANLVLQRGVRRDGSDAPGHLDAETASQILASARRSQAS